MLVQENETRSRQRTATIHREHTAKNTTNVFINPNNLNVLGFKHLVDIEGVTGSIPVAPTIQSHQTADFQAGVKQADSVGISAHFILPFRSLVAVAVSQADSSVAVSASKNSVPRAGGIAAGLGPLAAKNNGSLGS
jgi:hypothetical protein